MILYLYQMNLNKRLSLRLFNILKKVKLRELKEDIKEVEAEVVQVIVEVIVIVQRKRILEVEMIIKIIQKRVEVVQKNQEKSETLVLAKTLRPLIVNQIQKSQLY